MLDETERFENKRLSHDAEVLTPEIVAIRALIDAMDKPAEDDAA